MKEWKLNIPPQYINLTLNKIIHMNWYILIPFGIAMIALIVFLIKRNQKDETNFEQQLKDDYQKPKDAKTDATIDEEVK